MSKAAELAALISSQSALSDRNLIINGAMQVAQRGTSFSYAHDGTTNAFNLDRFSFQFASSENFDCTIAQVSDGPSGFSSSLKITTGTAESAVASDEYYVLVQSIEAQNLQKLSYGASSAKITTLSFYVKSSLTGTFGLSLYLQDDVRIINKTYTIDSANTWERKTINVVGDTTGVIDNDNGGGMYIYWNFGAGSDYDGASTATTWENYTTTNFMDSSSSDALVTTAGATWQMTGVQFELGEQATPFEHRSFGDELRRCQRYYYKITPGDTGGVGTGIHNATSQATIFIPYQVAMREGPTAVETSSTATDFDIRNNNGIIQLDSVPVFQSATRHGSEVLCNHSGSPTQGEATTLRFRTTSDFIAWSAEL